MGVRSDRSATRDPKGKGSKGGQEKERKTSERKEKREGKKKQEKREGKAGRREANRKATTTHYDVKKIKIQRRNI